MTDSESSSGSTAGPRPSRRTFVVAGGFALVLGAGGSGLAEVLRRTSRVTGRPQPPPALVAAVAAEEERIAAVDAALAAEPSLRAALQPIRANHLAHAQALRSLLPRSSGPSVARSTTPPPPPAPGRAALRSAESAASRAAAARALQLTGGAATLLASIAACEATHAELLS